MIGYPMTNCLVCKGRDPRHYCGREFCPIYQKFSCGIKKIELDFSGSSPPDIFVGRAGYPRVFAGILAPVGHVQDSVKLSSAEEWFARRMSIDDILASRGSLIYSRFAISVKGRSSIKSGSNIESGGDVRSNYGNRIVNDVNNANRDFIGSGRKKLLGVMKEISMAQKPCDAEFHLKKKPVVCFEVDRKIAPLGNVALLRRVTLTENPKIPHNVDYVVSDTDLRAVDGIMNLYFRGTGISSLIRLLSAALLGLKRNRKLTPSRWAVTAVDSIISEQLIMRIKRNAWINDWLVFHGDYVGNHYEFILIPRVFSSEIIEPKMGGSVWNPSGGGNYFMQDHESVYRRKKYASKVTGGYYAARLAVCEYLNKIRRQASVLVFREARPEYYAPLGVGILRELGRNCFRKKGERFDNLDDALKCAGSRLRIPVKDFVRRSKLIKEMNEQKELRKWM